MFSNIRTSLANKEIITSLTNKLNLGTENIISRIAFAYSVSSDKQLELKDIKDSKGKEYNAKVLFGEYTDYYIAIIALQYGIYAHDKDIGRYVKMHVDDGLELLNQEFQSNHNTTGFEFIASKMLI
ncbi:DNA sulfur modification protein DndE [Pedobacter ginsenosidimutans]|uniref:DNA sulfur modification protein DndE n=1 Tax=Pedobacter ginsenosidimutans TaxID=687842 RepID=A0A0T5VVA4_9SPHI|nr:DndE family protein [Pedobacter ginsenosidimutans]KRT17787.1 DNA sulfur modification protein DndE [Pedobacter ginsenosidimutans]